MKHLVFFSGGTGSFVSTLRAIEDNRWGGSTENIELLFTDTQIEHKTLYSFLVDAASHIYKKDSKGLRKDALNIPELYEGEDERKQALKKLRENVIDLFPNFHWLRYEVNGIPLDPWMIFYNEMFIGNSRIANCSKILKQRMARDFVRDFYNKDELHVYLGIDWSEIHRVKAPTENWSKFAKEVHFPLVHEPYLTGKDKRDMLEYLGIDIPELYKAGFEHNNCGGFCVRAGQGHFKRLFEHDPKLFEYHARKERELAELIRKYKGDGDYSILKKTKDGVAHSYTLDQLKEDIQKQVQIDIFDIGGCGCFVDDGDINFEVFHETGKWGMKDLVLIHD